MIGLKRPGALLGLAPALVLVMAGGDPTESPTEEPVDPDYAAGKPAMAVKDWPGAIRSLSSASLHEIETGQRDQRPWIVVPSSS